jgi:AcrR family transcriptional regulator
MEGNPPIRPSRDPRRSPGRKGRSGTRSAIQLPSGRHGLPASFVAKNQRDRIHLGMARAAREVGYPALTVEDVISRAGVSRRTFYDLYKTREAAYLEAYDEITGRLLGSVNTAFAQAGSGGDRLLHALGAFLQFVAQEPDFAHMCIVDVLAAGPSAIERRDVAMSAFAGLFDEAARELDDQPPSPLTATALVGGVYEVVYKHVLRGETERLPDLLPDLYYFCMLPYLGRQASRERYVELVAASA